MSSSLEDGLGMIVLVAVVIACALTNPQKPQHFQALSDKSELLGGLAGLASALGAVSYNNYVVCSTLTTADGKTITFGILKNVFPIEPKGNGG
jgi:hypothetical protein